MKKASGRRKGIEEGGRRIQRRLSCHSKTTIENEGARPMRAKDE
jgi:hypothetical protein